MTGPEGAPLVRVVRGNPSPDELAALVVALVAVRDRAATAPAARPHHRRRTSRPPTWWSPAAWAPSAQPWTGRRAA